MLDIFAKVLETLEISSVIDGCAVLDDEWWGKDVQSSFSRLYFIKSGGAYVRHALTMEQQRAMCI